MASSRQQAQKAETRFGNPLQSQRDELYVLYLFFLTDSAVLMEEALFVVQPYVAKAARLVAQPAQLFHDADSARRAGGRLARFRAGVVVLSQRLDPVSGTKERPCALAIYGRVPAEWGQVSQAA